MKLTLGFSPCPNDTFIFDALVHQEVDTEGIDYQYILADVEELNKKAFEQVLDVTKVSFHTYLFIVDKYVLLDSGAAMGFGAGPLVISRKCSSLEELIGKKVLIPGKYTTANLLFSMAMKGQVTKEEILFSDIETELIKDRADAGVIIHESRFTFKEKGLKEIMDLGKFWEDETGMPIPLGGIVISRTLPAIIRMKVARTIARSIEYASKNRELSEFVCCNAQEMKEEVMRKHIELYVNEYSKSLGTIGRAAVEELFRLAAVNGVCEYPSVNIFDD